MVRATSGSDAHGQVPSEVWVRSEAVRTYLGLAVLVAAVVAGSASAGSTYTFGAEIYTGQFDLVSGPEGYTADEYAMVVALASQFGVTIHAGYREDDGGALFDVAFFTFSNTAPFGEPGIASTITEIYWDMVEPAVLDTANFAFIGAESYGVSPDWELMPGDKVSPPVLPGGENLTPDFQVLAAAESAETGLDGIAVGEYATFAFDLGWDGSAQYTFEDLLAELLYPPDLRFGLHVSSIGETGDPSAAYWAPTQPVPTPPAVLLGLLGLGVVGLARVTKRGRKHTDG